MKTMLDFTNKIKPFFQGVAKIEPTTTAAATHNKGEKFYLDGTLVEVTADIAIGDTIAVNTNVKAVDDVEKQIANEVEVRAVNGGGHNLLDFEPQNRAIDTGLTITTNANHEIIVNGTSTTYSIIPLSTDVVLEESNDYVLSGCPSGGSGSTYKLEINLPSGFATDSGEGIDFTYSRRDGGNNCRIVVYAGTYNNLTFKPMIRSAKDAYAGYTQFIPTNAQLEENKVDWESNGVLGAHNLLPFNISELKAANTSGTWNGNVFTRADVDFTVNSDGTITVNGTASASLYFNYPEYPFKAGNYILSGCPTGGSGSTYYMTANSKYDVGEGIDVPQPSDGNIRVQFVMISGESLTNAVLKPMLRLATDTDPTYQPYAMTNRELTEKVAPYSISSSNGIVVERSGNMVHLYTDGIVATANVIGQTIVSESALRTKRQISSIGMLREVATQKYASHGCYVKTDGTIVFITDGGSNISTTTDFDYCTFDFMYFI